MNPGMESRFLDAVVPKEKTVVYPGDGVVSLLDDIKFDIMCRLFLKTRLRQDRCRVRRKGYCMFFPSYLSKNRYMYLKIDKLINGFNIIFSCVRKDHREKIKN